MGVRINAYAVDLPRFDTFLNTTLADLLRLYQRNGIDESTPLRFTIGGSCDMYEAVPNGQMRSWLGEAANRKHELLTEDRFRTVEDLQRSAREQLSKENIYQAYSLLNAFSNCKGIDFLKCLIGGHRRFWIGSLLQSAQRLLTVNEYRELEHLFASILRDYNSGFNMSIKHVGFITEGLPFVPDNDPDMQFGRWSEQECFTAVSLLTKIMASSPKFSCPPGATVFRLDDLEWEKWTHDNVLSLLQLRDLNFAKCSVLSFIH